MIPKEIIKKVRHIEIRTKGLVNDLLGESIIQFLRVEG